MANTDVVLQGVKDYTLELLGTKARDEAVASADRSEAAATRAEAAAESAEVGILDDTVARQHLVPGLREELDGKAERSEVPTTAADVNARPDTWVPTAAEVGARPVTWTPTAQEVGAATPAYVDQEVGKKADTSHTHSLSDISGLPDEATPSAVGNTVVTRTGSGHFSVSEPSASSHAASKEYVDERIQLVTDWPSSPTPGVLYLMEEG